MSRTSLACLALAFLPVLACGDDANDAADADLSGIDASSTGEDSLPPQSYTLYALGTDGSSTGILSSLLIDDAAPAQAKVTQDVLAGVAASDSVLRAHNDYLFVVNRFGSDNVSILKGNPLSLVDQVSTGNGTNPQDVAVVGDTLYVCALASASILTIDLSDIQATPGAIDISSYDDDASPDCSSIVAVDGKVLATLAAFDENFTSSAGTVVVIDPGTDTIVGDFSLAYNNPFAQLQVASTGAFEGEVLVATTESFGASDGCVERLTLGETPASAGCLAEASDLGGYVSRVAASEDGVLALVNTSFTTSELVALDSEGETSATITGAALHATDFARCPDGTIVTNDTQTGGLRVFAPGSSEPSASLDIGLPTAFANGMLCR